MKKLIGPVLLFLIMLIIVSQVSALGVMPSSKSMLIDEIQTYTLKIVNNDKLDFTAFLEIQGGLSEYISLSQEKIEFKKTDDIQRVVVTINIPEGLSIGEGDYENYIIIEQKFSQTANVKATVSLAHKLTITKPYSEEALQVKTFVTNFERGKQNNFVIEIKSLGVKDIPEAIPIIEIYSATNHKLETLTADKISLKSGEKKLVDIPWTPEVPNGKYLARAFVIYGEKTAAFDKAFSVGRPEVFIDSITANAFRLGEVASLNIIISSTWVEPIENVFANIALNKGDRTVYSGKTANKGLSSLGKTNLPAFIDTKGLEPGKYALDITLNYLDMTKQKVFEIFLEQNNIRISGATGQVSADTEKEGSSIPLLIILVLVLVVLNMIVVYKFVILKKKKE